MYRLDAHYFYWIIGFPTLLKKIEIDFGFLFLKVVGWMITAMWLEFVIFLAVFNFKSVHFTDFADQIETEGINFVSFNIL